MGLFSRKNKEDKKDDKSVAKKVEKKEIKKTDKKDVKTTEKKVVKKSNKKAGEAYRFLLRPIISEKATVAAADSKYTFEVDNKANKVSVRQAVEEVYGVSPKSVNILNQSGKNVRFGRKFGRTKNVKKAVVTLRKGDSIKLYEGI